MIDSLDKLRAEIKRRRIKLSLRLQASSEDYQIDDDVFKAMSKYKSEIVLGLARRLVAKTDKEMNACQTQPGRNSSDGSHDCSARNATLDQDREGEPT